MTGFALFAILAAATGYAEMINRRYLRLPTAMGLVIISLVAVVVVHVLDYFGLNASEAVQSILPTGDDFRKFFINSSLALMLYAAAISIDINVLRRHALPILFFASIGTVISVVLVGAGTFWISQLLGIPISVGVALLFGAIIAPTDPIAVSRITEKIKGCRTWKAIVTGESLFNDAIALVIFTVVFAAVQHHEHMTGLQLLQVFATEILIAVGVGAGLALVMGVFSFLMHGESGEGRVLVSIGLAAGSFSLADYLGGSGPIAVVISGLTAMWLLRHSPTLKPLDTVLNFWTMIERCLAAMFFLLVGLEVLTVDWKLAFLLLGVAAWVAVFAARVLTVIIGYVGLAVVLQLGSAFHFIMPVSLAGVRGALSVALALSLPMVIGDAAENRELILAMTFGAVVIGILLQGAGLMAASPSLNKHRSNRVRLRKPIRSVLISAREMKHQRKRR